MVSKTLFGVNTTSSVQGAGFICQVCQSSSSPPLGLIICQEISQNSVSSHIHSWIDYSKRIQSKISKEKGTLNKIWRKLDTSFQQFLLPVESDRMQLIPPLLSCDHTCDMCSPEKASTRETCLSLSASGRYLQESISQKQSRMEVARGWQRGNGVYSFNYAK